MSLENLIVLVDGGVHQSVGLGIHHTCKDRSVVGGPDGLAADFVFRLDDPSTYTNLPLPTDRVVVLACSLSAVPLAVVESFWTAYLYHAKSVVVVSPYTVYQVDQPDQKLKETDPVNMDQTQAQNEEWLRSRKTESGGGGTVVACVANLWHHKTTPIVSTFLKPVVDPLGRPINRNDMIPWVHVDDAVDCIVYLADHTHDYWGRRTLGRRFNIVGCGHRWGLLYRHFNAQLKANGEPELPFPAAQPATTRSCTLSDEAFWKLIHDNQYSHDPMSLHFRPNRMITDGPYVLYERKHAAQVAALYDEQ